MVKSITMEKVVIFLSVIIPVRFTLQREDILTRLWFCLEDDHTPNSVEFIVIDDATEPEKAKQLAETCSELGLRYLATGAQPKSAFNLARARNYAARYAKGRLIMFMDIDLKPYMGFYRDIINEAELMDMGRQIDKFLMCPVIYLTKQGSIEFDNKKTSLRRQFGINAMLYNDSNLVEKYSHGTSVIVVNRHYYLSIGGQNEDFEGWGYEDYEFTIRLMMKNPQFPTPEDWPSMSGHFMTVKKYKGWKAAYRLHGDWLANKGIYLFHIDHPVDKLFQSNPRKNQRLLKKQLKRGKRVQNPTPLSYPEAGRSLLFRDNPFCYSYEIAPFLGEVFFEKETRFSDLDLLSNYLAENHIDRIVFPNPYANAALLVIYNWCRKFDFPMVIAERGALPDSIYHDKGGFLSDSDSYSRGKWDKPLTKEQQDIVQSYMHSIRVGSHMLEKQASRQDIIKVRQLLGISESKKVIFVPFQQPNDTVIHYFSGGVGGFDEFHRIISNLSIQLGNEWCVIYKKHPAEDFLPAVTGAICADAFNTYDLIEIADALVVINSGVGLYGAMFGKPVYILGEAWYQHKGMNFYVENPDRLSSMIKTDAKICTQMVERFIYYLRYQFYSFGIQQQRRSKNDKGFAITSTTSIDYYEVRNFKLYIFLGSDKPLPFSSPLFDRYRGSSMKSRTYDNYHNVAIRRIKLRKLKEKPVQFLVDAIKNIWH